MAEELLDGTKVGSGIEEMGGERMTDGMGSYFFLDRSLLDILI